MRKLAFPALCALISFAILPVSRDCRAQQVASSDIPDAPAPQQTATAGANTTTPQEHSDPQTKRILGIFPNFRAVSAESHLPPQSVKDKFVTASEDSFDYSAFVLPAAIAGESELS